MLPLKESQKTINVSIALMVKKQKPSIMEFNWLALRISWAVTEHTVAEIHTILLPIK